VTVPHILNLGSRRRWVVTVTDGHFTPVIYGWVPIR